MSHHFDSPTAIADGRLNLCDVFAFHGSPGHSVLVMTVNPDAGRSSPVTFNPEAIYELAIDTGGGVDQQIGLRVQFDEPEETGRQSFRVSLAQASALDEAGGGTTAGRGVTESSGSVSFPGLPDGRIWAGLAADPFWADGAALFAFLQAAGEGQYRPEVFAARNNIFENRNVTAIVLEIPDDLLGAGRSSVWATITLQGHAPSLRVSRMGQPMLRPLFFNVPGPDAESLNAEVPARDREMHAERVMAVALRLAILAGDHAPLSRARSVAEAFLPDVLGYTPEEPARFRPGGDNGRTLTDDAFGAAFGLVTGSAIAGSATPFTPRHVFPYVTPPHHGDLPALADLFGLRAPGVDRDEAKSA